MRSFPEGDSSLTLRYRIEKRIVDVSKRKYVNMDPHNDRPDYDHLQIHEEYKGYKDAIYTPIDMPKIDVDLDHIESLWADPNMEEGTTAGTIAVGKVLFLKKNMFTYVDGNPPWYAWAKQEIPHICDFIDQLPFKSIRQCAFVQPPDVTPPHYDEPLTMTPHLIDSAPSQYRIRWSKVTDKDNEIFYMSKDSGATKIYPVLPDETNTYVYDGSVWEHGTDRGFKMNERALIVMSGIIDIPKHHALLERSMNKYKDFVLYDKEFETSISQS